MTQFILKATITIVIGDARRREWRTPLRMARKGGRDQAIRILTEAGAKDYPGAPDTTATIPSHSIVRLAAR